MKIGMHIKRLLNRISGKFATKRLVKCQWCGRTIYCKSRWIYSRTDPVGKLVCLCNRCVSDCKAG